MWDDEVAIFEVVRNDEGQYSIWPQEMSMPPGWVLAGKAGRKVECLAYIDEVWVDMRPASLIAAAG